MKLRYLHLIGFLFFWNTHNYAQQYPGGVLGAEVWYIADNDDIGSGYFENFAETQIVLEKCGDCSKGLFNFNPTIVSDKLCLSYRTSIENSIGRNLFTVSEPIDTERSYSHFATAWRQDFASAIANDSIIRNFFDLNNGNILTKDILEDYHSDSNANVNFYHINDYNIDKKFKSYGLKGETEMVIGKKITVDPSENYDDNHFNGKIPEFISFPKELSFNERNRVESYLALKYGLTLSQNRSYLNSKNVMFWDSENSGKFKNRIFGFGRDDRSGLYQLQSESTHLKDHLIGAIGEILQTNLEKQLHENIPDNSFLLFGDNGDKFELGSENQDRIKFCKKIWLAQRTGRGISEKSIYFKLYLSGQLTDYLDNNPDETLWLLQDPFVNNTEVSDFNSSNIIYHEVVSLNANQTVGSFKDIFFDQDDNIYDQFTFGVGARMIVQANVQGCKSDRIEVILNITGGKAPYRIVVESSAGNFQTDINDNGYGFLGQPGSLYDITVIDANGLTVDIEFTPEPWDMSVDLGPDQELTATQPEITLDAGQNIPDPDATYQWYLNGALLPNTASTLVVTEPGQYEVDVTSADQSCTVSDSIVIKYGDFSVVVSKIDGCEAFSNVINLEVNGGIPPYTTLLATTNSSTNYAHSDDLVITDLAYGSYTITVADSSGEFTVSTIDLVQPPENYGVDIYTQLDALCPNFIDCLLNNETPPLYGISNGVQTGNFTLNASLGVSYPGLSYEWILNDDTFISSSPSLSFLLNNNSCYVMGSTLITLNVYSASADCDVSFQFRLKGICPDFNGATAPLTNTNLEDNENTALNTIINPNPVEPNTSFTYQVYATENFNGNVQIFTMHNVLLNDVEINGSSSYTLPFILQTSGMYVIKTVSSLGIVKSDYIIIK